MSARVGLIRPKYPHNLGQIVRVAACYGVDHVYFTGNRMTTAMDKLSRLPREERIRDYKSVMWMRNDYFITSYANDGYVPVCVEVSDRAESLVDFIHPKNALYVFGPEDGSIPRGVKTACHSFVCIPTRHCLNLSVAVATVLYDRVAKSHASEVAA